MAESVRTSSPLFGCGSQRVVDRQLARFQPRQCEPTTTHLARVLNGAPPDSLAELQAIQDRIRELTPQIIPATVAIQVGRANGSGVVIDAEGHVLTAAHVAGHPGRNAMIHFPNGRTARGTTLGLNQELDAGLIRITDKGPWPFVPLGTSAQVQEGAWCLATGHPGGFDPGRPPVLRWGRVLKAEPSAILSDCTLVGGDSGGPLFNLRGEVIGIHSRIGKNLTINVHVPIDPFRASWDRLARGEVWGLLRDADDAEQDAPPAELAGEPKASEASGSIAWLGVVEDPDQPGVQLLRVAPGSPAADAGLQPGDQITRIDEREVDHFGALQAEIRRRQPGQQAVLQIRRNELLYELRVRLGRRLRNTTE